jgi:hypothetical protein
MDRQTVKDAGLIIDGSNHRSRWQRVFPATTCSHLGAKLPEN